MIKYEFSSKFIARYNRFLISEYYKNECSHAKTDYWNFHADKSLVKIEDNNITVDGVSGFYVPPSKRIVHRLINGFKKVINNPFLLIPFIKRKIGIPESGVKLLSYSDAFDRVMSHEPIADIDLSPYRINFLKSRGRGVASIKDIKKIYIGRDRYKLDDHVIRSYYYYNILNDHINKAKRNRIIEIGGGNGNLISVIKQFSSKSTVIDIDLPETIASAIAFIKDLFPASKILMPHEIKSDNFSEYDFVFMVPSQASLISDNSIDLTINTASFQEMTHDQIEEYYKLIQRVNYEGSFFFTSNRVEKIPCGPNSYEVETLAAPNRFSEYPWDENNKTLIYEVCRLTRLVQLDNAFIRLDVIQK